MKEKILKLLYKYTERQSGDYYLHGTIIATQFEELAEELTHLKQ